MFLVMIGALLLLSSCKPISICVLPNYSSDEPEVEPGPAESMTNISKVDPVVLDYLKNHSLKRVYAMIHFNQSPSPKERKWFKETYNITLDSYKDRGRWISAIPTARLLTLINLKEVLNISFVEPHSKIWDFFFPHSLPGHVVNDNGTLNMIVQFYDDVTEQEALEVTGRHASITHSGFPYEFRDIYIIINNESMLPLAHEDIVKEIAIMFGPIGIGPVEIVDEEAEAKSLSETEMKTVKEWCLTKSPKSHYTKGSDNKYCQDCAFKRSNHTLEELKDRGLDCGSPANATVVSWNPCDFCLDLSCWGYEFPQELVVGTYIEATYTDTGLISMYDGQTHRLLSPAPESEPIAYDCLQWNYTQLKDLGCGHTCGGDENNPSIGVIGHRLVIKKAYHLSAACGSVEASIQRNDTEIDIFFRWTAGADAYGCIQVVGTIEGQLEIPLEKGIYHVTLYDLKPQYSVCCQKPKYLKEAEVHIG